MRNPRLFAVALGLLVLGLVGMQWLQRPPPPQFAPGIGSAPPAPPAATQRPVDALPPFLPPQARATIDLIQAGGPFPHRQDGSTFQNRERHLPPRPRGYYREYTVDTPGMSHRGARRIVTGGDPPEAWYYTSDHYETFRSFKVPAPTGTPDDPAPL